MINQYMVFHLNVCMFGSLTYNSNFVSFFFFMLLLLLFLIVVIYCYPDHLDLTVLDLETKEL